MKSLWDFGIGLQANAPGVSPTEPTILHDRAISKNWPSYISVLSTATAAAIYPFALDQDHSFFGAAMRSAIAIGAFPILKQASGELLRKRLGAAFCVSLALGLALSVNEYLVALALLVWALMTKTVEDWSRRRVKQLLAGSSRFPPARGRSGRFPALEGFEKDTSSWLQSFFVYLATAAAAFAFVAKADVKSAFAALIVGSASALTLNMSILRLGSLLRMSKHGFVISDESFVERLASANVVVLDESAGVDRFQNAANAIGVLRAMTIKTILFTDALQPAAIALAERLGTDRVEAELFSEDKPCKIAAMRQRRCKVVCLGGTAEPSLAAADIAIATGPEPGMRLPNADAVLLSKDMNDLAKAVRTSRRANLVGAVNCVIVVVVSSAILGLAIQGKIAPQSAIEVRLILDLALAALSAQFLIPVWNRNSVSVN